MKMVKSLLLGSAAGLVAVAGAQAADLPVKAKPVQYVKICSLYGAGFYYIPGTDTCIKVGGAVRFEYDVNAGGSFNPYRTVTLDSRSKVLTTNRARGLITADARSQTEYGTLRAYVQLGVNYDDGATAPSEGWDARAFIQWAGFTFGRAVSFFDFYVTPAYSNQTNVWSSDTGGSGDTVAAYTAQLGNGLSATLSLEDQAYRRTQITGGGEAYAGYEWPDIVGNLRIDQAWGSAQIMAAAHQVRGTTVGNEVGWAAGAGLTLNLPWSKGDTVSTQFTYSKGAMAYVGSTLGTGFAITSGGNTATGTAADAVNTGGSLDLTEGWSVVAGASHNWNSMWNTTLYGSYGELNYSAAANATLGVVDADWNFYQVGSRTTWKPVQNLAFSVDLMYNHLDGQNTGVATTSANQGWWQGIFRVQRDFWP